MSAPLKMQGATPLQTGQRLASFNVPSLRRGSTCPGWRDETIELARVRWLAGKSASEIAAEIGDGMTRNAVIGKIARMGLSGRVKAPPPKPKRPRGARRPGPPRTFSPAREPVLAEPIEIPALNFESLLIPLWEIKEGQCRWPIGDPRDVEGFRFCGLPTQDEKCWCPSHWRVGREGSQRRAVHNPLGITKAPRVFLDTSKDREEAA